MDFLKLLKSFAEPLNGLLLLQVVYPVTMWRSVVRPLGTQRYADVELTDKPEDWYQDTLSPPLFLPITLDSFAGTVGFVTLGL